MATSTGDKLLLLTRVRLGKFDGVDRLPLEEFCELAVDGGGGGEAGPDRVVDCYRTVMALLKDDMEFAERPLVVPQHLMRSMKLHEPYETSQQRQTREDTAWSAQMRGDVVEPRHKASRLTEGTVKTYFITRVQAFSIKDKLEACRFWGEGVQLWCVALEPMETKPNPQIAGRGDSSLRTHIGTKEAIRKLDGLGFTSSRGRSVEAQFDKGAARYPKLFEGARKEATELWWWEKLLSNFEQHGTRAQPKVALKPVPTNTGLIHRAG